MVVTMANIKLCLRLTSRLDHKCVLCWPFLTLEGCAGPLSECIVRVLLCNYRVDINDVVPECNGLHICYNPHDTYVITHMQ